MGFIREYSNDYAGDPFSLRRPKWLKKLKVGRAIGKVAKFAAPLALGGVIPGGASLLRAFQAARAQIAGIPGADERLVAFARGYGFDMAGDPGRGPKRKAAAAGPKAKATRKREKRAGGKPAGGGRRGKKGTKGKPMAGGQDAHDLAAQIAHAVTGAGGAIIQDIPVLGTAVRAGKAAGSAFHIPGERKRGHMNPANVRALRRSLRRVEGFEKLVKRVEKMFPRMRRAVGHAPRSGHRAGCRCFACKRRAA